LAVIRNHVAGHFYKAEANTRFWWYPETYAPGQGWAHWTPTLWLDGVEDVMELYENVNLTWSVYRDEIGVQLEVPSPLEMDIQVFYGAKGDTGTVDVQVVAATPISFSDLRLRLAIVESDLSWAGDTWNQVLRDYFPTWTGISFSIAQGDTFTHSEDFVIQTGWDDENCDLVVFVQDHTTRDVLQAIQSPLIVPIPEAITDLAVTLVEDDLVLNWSPVALDTYGHPLRVDYYRVYRDNVPVFLPGAEPFDTATEDFYVDGTGVVGDVGTNYYYAVTAVAGYKESGFSRWVGEIDRVLASE
jgi:hypothetical protein